MESCFFVCVQTAWYRIEGEGVESDEPGRLSGVAFYHLDLLNIIDFFAWSLTSLPGHYSTCEIGLDYICAFIHILSRMHGSSKL
jgi:hypothetical protein